MEEDRRRIFTSNSAFYCHDSWITFKPENTDSNEISQQMRHMQIEFEQWKTHDIWEQERESVEFNLKFIT